jgi:uncharacterized cupin superfamily protein
LLPAAAIAARAEMRIRHPWNSNSEVYLKRLAHDTGLPRAALTMARVPPGKESFIYHSHERDEEFLFIYPVACLALASGYGQAAAHHCDSA